MLRWFGSSAEMWQYVVTCFGNRWCQWLTASARPDPGRAALEPVRVTNLLPLTGQEVSWTRVWLALVEAGRTRPDLAPRVLRVERHELDLVVALLARAVGVSRAEVPDRWADLTLAVVRGLRHAVCAVEEPMPLERAHALLDAQVDQARIALTQR